MEMEEFNWSSSSFFFLCFNKRTVGTLGWRSTVGCTRRLAHRRNPHVHIHISFSIICYVLLYRFILSVSSCFRIRIFSTVSAKVIWITTKRSSIGFPRDHHHLRACVRVSIRAEWHCCWVSGSIGKGKRTNDDGGGPYKKREKTKTFWRKFEKHLTWAMCAKFSLENGKKNILHDIIK
jgi:hypothetical protein